MKGSQSIAGFTTATVFFFLVALAGCGSDSETKTSASEGIGTEGPECFIDTHVHLHGKYGRAGQEVVDYEAAADKAFETMDEIGVDKALVMPPPISADPNQRGKYDYTELLEVTKKHRKQLGFLGGGGTLNPMIQQAADTSKITSETRRSFEEKADEIVSAGAVGFGEMTALHFSFRAEHPYEEVRPDHPLFLLLADIAARKNVPIDLHMEAVSSDIPLPDELQSPPNPEEVDENIEAFKKLLSHNRAARIVWVHAGWDTTGHRTVKLMRKLLKSNPNLYMSLKTVGRGREENRPDENGKIKSEWKDLIAEFPNRFVVGSDQFYSVPGTRRVGPPSTKSTWNLVGQLPSNVASKVVCDNARSIYRLR